MPQPNPKSVLKPRRPMETRRPSQTRFMLLLDSNKVLLVHEQERSAAAVEEQKEQTVAVLFSDRVGSPTLVVQTRNY